MYSMSLLCCDAADIAGVIIACVSQRVRITQS